MLLPKLVQIARSSKVLRGFVYRGFFTSQKMHTGMAFLKRLSGIAPFPSILVWSFIKRKEENENSAVSKEILLAKADALYDQGKYQQIYDILSQYKDDTDVEVLWRLSRALYYMAKAASETEAKKMIYEAYDLISTALNIREDHYAVHKWMSILLDSKCSYDGMKARIKQLYVVKQHMLRAMELNPKDATTLYMLGNWCYQVSDLAWYQRKIAMMIFGKLPVSSFEEALNYFETAEKTDPNFYSHNLLMLGKTYLKLNRKDDAVKYLKLTSEFPARNDDDHKAKQEAQKLLSSL